jgi:hypothetical protein
MSRYVKLTKYWGIEICFNIWSFNQAIELSSCFRIQHKGDHKGIFFNLIFFNCIFEFNLYDSRHEDYE